MVTEVIKQPNSLKLWFYFIFNKGFLGSFKTETYAYNSKNQFFFNNQFLDAINRRQNRFWLKLG
jgi:hypothetical protein